MKSRILFLTCLVSFSAKCQTASFPQNWVGDWKGELIGYKMGEVKPKNVNMELRIHPTDSSHHFTWQLIYGCAAEDNRPYLLKPIEEAKGHWVIDELNGIVLDQFWLADKFCGAFTVSGNTIVNSYQLTNDRLHIEFYSIGAKPIGNTGNGTEDSPQVDTYRIGSYQKAVLVRTK